MYTTVKELIKELNATGGNLSGVYKITRISDGKVYIGQSENIAKRIESHINNVHENDSEKIDGAIQKDGWQNFTYEIILALPELNTEQLWLAESTNIAKFNSFNNGFNKTKGNHIGKYDHEKFIKENVVSADLTKKIRDHFKLNFKEKKILLINLFDEKFIDVLKYNDCEVTIIGKYFETKEEKGEYIMSELEKLKGMKFDLIIANPPYGKPGANITKKIINTIEYDEFINLLPVNDYKKDDDKNLYKYADISTMTPLDNYHGEAFNDAAVTPYVARINKKPSNYISWEYFQIENYVDDSLTNYFYENLNRKHYAIDAMPTGGYSRKNAGIWPIETTFIVGMRDMNHKHLPYSRTCTTYNWNVNNVGTMESLPAMTNNTQLSVSNCIFKTKQEKQNFVNFIYSKDGFRFISKIFTAINCDGTVKKHVFPKVDWTRSWTVEEILKDYGYTEDEIKEVMEDLKNFKGMED